MPKPQPRPAPYISITEAAERSGLTHQWIHQLVAKGKDGPFPGACQLTKESNSPYLIPATEFEAWLRARET
jgi:predicted DNA-binding transcriptional regulator AlpA